MNLEGSPDTNSDLPPNLMISGGDDRARTGDLLRAKQVLSQLSYVPVRRKLEAEGWKRLTSKPRQRGHFSPRRAPFPALAGLA